MTDQPKPLTMLDPFDAKKLLEAFQALQQAQGAYQALLNFIGEKYQLAQGDLLNLTAAIVRAPESSAGTDGAPKAERKPVTVEKFK